VQRFNALVLTVLLTILSFVPSQTQTALAVEAKKHAAVTPQKGAAKWWVDRHAKHVARMKEGKVDLLMIGDSITHLWEDTQGTIFHKYAHGANVWTQYYGSRRAMNLGFAGDRTENVLWRLDNLPLGKISPKAAAVMIGTNNVNRLSSTPRQTAEGIQAIVRKLRGTYPEMKILVLHVFPRGPDPENGKRKRVRELNSCLPELIGKEKNVTLLDIGDKFLDEKGMISTSIMPDFLHPNANGYEIWAKAMEPTLEELLGEKAADKVFKRDRYLLLDSRIVERAENAKLTLGMVKKHEANPLMKEEHPWESRFDNLYGNVIYDKEAQIYKCWYNTFLYLPAAKGMTLAQRKKPYAGGKSREMGICYATSKDGIRWEKPKLGLVEFEGGKENNLVWRGPHGAGVFKDPRDPDPKRRYKTIFMSKRLSYGFSTDGIRWGGEKPCGINVRGDTHNNALWAPTLGKYVAFTRTYGGRKRRTRQVARTESKDFVKWTPQQVVMMESPNQTYSMPVFYHGGVYLGLVSVYRMGIGRVWTELAWSPDTIKWHRINRGSRLIPNSDKELDYDYGCVYACATPVFLKDEIRLYYGGSDWLHSTWRNAFLCLATLRPDGFAGYEQESRDKPSVIITTPIAYRGQPIQVTADVGLGGSVKMSVLDEAGNTLAVAKTITSTVTDTPLELDKKVEVKKVRLKFELNSENVWYSKSKLYSFSFRR